MTAEQLELIPVAILVFALFAWSQAQLARCKPRRDSKRINLYSARKVLKY